ncbi:hypothetical protein GE061_014539 [Apolygus lucorum]|uniref:Uncharacterized protein n=1 Tax=Apolygus lucorum TaxID=248454 RepID=A0A8S9XJN5_APOLU|nr:hypothetical protein GE061_014539 [Apolygus lucorum]
MLKLNEQLSYHWKVMRLEKHPKLNNTLKSSIRESLKMSSEQPPISNPAASADEQTQKAPSISTAAAAPSNPASSTSAPGPRESGQAKEKKPCQKCGVSFNSTEVSELGVIIKQ